MGLKPERSKSRHLVSGCLILDRLSLRNRTRAGWSRILMHLLLKIGTCDNTKSTLGDLPVLISFSHLPLVSNEFRTVPTAVQPFAMRCHLPLMSRLISTILSALPY